MSFQTFSVTATVPKIRLIGRMDPDQTPPADRPRRRLRCTRFRRFVTKPRDKRLQPCYTDSKPRL